MGVIQQIFKKIEADMDKIEEFEKKKDYDSAITVLQDQITFLEGYLTGEKDLQISDYLDSLLRDRRILIRVFKVAKKLDALEKATDDRIGNLLYKISKIEKELDVKKEGK